MAASSGRAVIVTSRPSGPAQPTRKPQTLTIGQASRRRGRTASIVETLKPERGAARLQRLPAGELPTAAPFYDAGLGKGTDETDSTVPGAAHFPRPAR